MDEYQKRKKKLKTGKSAGEDGTLIGWKSLNTATLTNSFNRLLLEGKMPQQWSDINIIRLPKTEDLGYTTNYHGIGLTAVVTKMVNKLLLKRIQPKLYPHLRKIKMDLDPVDQQRHTSLRYEGLLKV